MVELKPCPFCGAEAVMETFTTAREGVPRFREIAGETFNSLQDCCQVLDAISRSMVGDADTNRSQPEIKCFRDNLIASQETARYVLNKLNEIAEVLGALYSDMDNFQSDHGKLDENMKHALEKAEKLAREAHQGQTDKSGADYIGHPLRVSARCKSPEAKIAGLLHDTIEDTYVTPQLLKDMGFGDDIVDAVLALSRRADETYAEFIVRASQNEIAKEVKIADLEDNMDIRRLPEISEKDAARLKKYLHSWRYLQGLEKTTDLIRD